MDAASRRFPNTPSFSSTLLDEIYRSIDLQSPVRRDANRKHQNKFSVINSSDRCFEEEEEDDDDDDERLRRALLIQKWMENKKPVVGRRSAVDLHESFWFDSSCSSSNSTSGGGCGGGGGFALSDGESMIDGVPVKPRPIRTVNKQRIMYGHEDSLAKPEHEGKFVKTKSKALKIYSELKKVKQPVSPGGRLARLLNSLFTTGNNKKPNTNTTAGGFTESTRSRLDRKSKSANASTCSSASSFSRSCLSNTPSSRGKSSTGGEKRSVRFFPVSVIVDEDCQPCGHKSLEKEETKLNRIKSDRNYIKEEKNSRISETARSLLKNYQKKVECEFGLVRDHKNEKDLCDEAESDSSSDLFELDNLSAIGMSKYQEELPVYKTTRLRTNQAIANGVFM